MHLRFPLGVRSMPVPICERVFKNVSKRLARWKTTCLSIGRATLFKVSFIKFQLLHVSFSYSCRGGEPAREGF